LLAGARKKLSFSFVADLSAVPCFENSLHFTLLLFCFFPIFSREHGVPQALMITLLLGRGGVPSLVQFDRRPLGGANFQY
jgi:hypothetical protein